MLLFPLRFVLRPPEGHFRDLNALPWLTLGFIPLLLVSTLLYLFPPTAILGAILVTAYLGGAVATNVRISAPVFTNVLVPVYVGVLVWGGFTCATRACEHLSRCGVRRLLSERHGLFEKRGAVASSQQIHAGL